MKDTMLDIFTWLLRGSLYATLMVPVLLLIQKVFQKKISPHWMLLFWLAAFIRPFSPVSPPVNFGLYSMEQLSLINRFNYQTETAPDILTILFFIWGAGVILYTLIILLQTRLYINRLRKNSRKAETALLAIVTQCKKELRINRRIRCVESPEAQSPSVYGVIHPVIVLPEGITQQFNRDELRCILLHELTHVRKWDTLINWGTTLLKALHWFNPAIRFGLNRIQLFQEASCDASVLSRLTDAERNLYGRTILRCSTRNQTPSGMVGVSENKKQIKRRIIMIARFKTLKSRAAVLSASLAIFAAFAFLTCGPEIKPTENTKFSNTIYLSRLKMRKQNHYFLVNFGSSRANAAKLLVGETIRIIQPGFKILNGRVLGINRGGNSITFTYKDFDKIKLNASDFVILSKKRMSIIRNNYRRFQALWKQPEITVVENAQKAIQRAASEYGVKKLWRNIETMIRISRSNAPQTTRAQALFTAGTLFYREFTQRSRKKGEDLRDPATAREVLRLVTRLFPHNDMWVKRSWYNLAALSDSLDWKKSNREYYTLLKKAGEYGKPFFELGKNILNTMEKDSILFTEGGDNQVFSLQILLQIERVRPDITVYDQKGNVFDNIYGDFRKMDRKTIRKRRITRLEYVILNRKPPKETILINPLPRKSIFRKRTGGIYFTWRIPALKKINKRLKARRLPQYELRPTGLLYKLVQKGSRIPTRQMDKNIWASYRWSGTIRQWKNYPYMMREVFGSQFFNRAYNAYTSKKFGRMLTLLEKANAIVPDSYPFPQNAAFLCLRASRKTTGSKKDFYLKKAIAYFDMCITLQPRNGKLYRFKGMMYRNLGDKKQARELLGKAIDLGDKPAKNILRKL